MGAFAVGDVEEAVVEAVVGRKRGEEAPEIGFVGAVGCVIATAGTRVFETLLSNCRADYDDDEGHRQITENS